MPCQTGHGLDGLGFQSRHKQISFQNVQTDPGVHTLGTGTSCPGIMRPGREADDSCLFKAQVNEWSYIFAPLYAFMAYREVLPYLADAYR